MTTSDDRFGMPESAFEAARRAHGVDSPVIRLGMYVPTRREVTEWSPDSLYEVLIDWMWESPSELIPNNMQIGEVVKVLESRADAGSVGVQRLLDECHKYLAV